MNYVQYENHDYQISEYSEISNSEYAKSSLFMLLLIPFIVCTIAFSALPGFNLLAIGLGMVCSIGLVLNVLKNGMILPKEWVLLLLFLLWSSFGFIVAESYFLFLTLMGTMTQILVMVTIIVVFVKSFKDLNWALGAFLVGAIIVGMSAVVSGEYRNSTTSTDVVAGLSGNANQFQLIIVYSVIPILYFVKIAKNLLLKVGFIVLLLGMIKLIIASSSREGLLAVIILIISWLFFTYRKDMFKKPVTFMMVILITIGCGIYIIKGLADSHVLERMTITTDLIQGIEKDNSSSLVRVLLIKQALMTFKDNFFMGVGLDNFKMVSGYGLYAHNNYAELLATTGFFGGLTYFMIYAFWAKRLWKLSKRNLIPTDMCFVNISKAVLIMRVCADMTRVSYYLKINWIMLAILIGYAYHLDAKTKDQCTYEYYEDEYGNEYEGEDEENMQIDSNYDETAYPD